MAFKIKENPKKIIMKYPTIEGNYLCDGRAHEIEPIRIRTFNYRGREFIVMDYVDLEYNSQSTTLLLREGDRYYKIPFEDYEDFDRVIESHKPRTIDISELDNVRLIGYKKPLANIHTFERLREKEPVRKEPEIKKPEKPANIRVNKPEHRTQGDNRAVVIVYFDEDGNFFISPAAAHVLFDLNQNAYDESPTYRISLEQLAFIKENYAIRWSFLRKPTKNGEPYVPDDRSNIQRLAQALMAASRRAGIDVHALFERYVPVHYVAINCDDSDVYRGVFNATHLESGTHEYRHLHESDSFRRVNPSEAEAYFDYLREIVYAHEVNETLEHMRDARRREALLRRYSFRVEDIPDFLGRNAVYRFVGRWDGPFKLESVKPLEHESDIKDTLSSCLLGYVDSACSGTIYDEEFFDEGRSNNINISKIRDKAHSRKK